MPIYLVILKKKKGHCNTLDWGNSNSGFVKLGVNYEIGFISKNMRSVTHCLYGESTHTH